ncbi:T9SS type A sorting domain-containing protein [Hymenobacter sp. CRA2]|uniref:T9SS type A sorting domain-containing protein n=1 Tax=Hymenobacter sp. CRA2 TaxID=1955620 RepID=UPI00098F2E50|nr:T9SS type A sorting domain-containing protein [Hymenobacter sp. CRA2]OON68325.1 hypothetical protein B0919_14335 [Hymenobacter sp. CRA2]
MLQTYLRKTLWLGLCLSALSTQAQYLFKSAPDASVGSNGLGPYTQNFDALAGTNRVFTSNSTLKAVYAKYTLNGVSGEFESGARGTGAVTLRPDDGSQGYSRDVNGNPNGADWYHFGESGATDRAFGGIAATNTAPGVGYIGIRLKNTSGVVIKNLEIEYAMEQWYNSSQTQAANVAVAYQRSTATAGITSLTSGTWTAISALNVAAPSTSTAIAPRDGNADTNRRVMRTTLMGLNIANNEEIMIRWSYTFNSTTNGNGLSIDDVVITPQTNIYYSKNTANSNLDSRNSWGLSADGSGTVPPNFTTDNTVYYVRGTSNADRINGTWTVSGANSKIIVGTPTEAATLYVGPNDQIAGKVDINPTSTLQIQQANTNLTLGAVSSASTVEYIFPSNATTQRVQGGSYGALKLTGAGNRTLASSALINSWMSFDVPTNSFASLSLGNNDLTLIKGAGFSGLGDQNTLIVTNGTGALRQTVTNNGSNMLFPVASTAAATAYTPVTLSQPSSASQSEDTYSVRVSEGVYHTYDSNEVGQGRALTSDAVNKTWLVSEEVPGNSNVTMQLYWSTAHQTSTFTSSRAFIDHYTGGRWEGVSAFSGAAPAGAGLQSVGRAGITSFSPFGVSTSQGQVLPVALLSFTAKRTGDAVTCRWATAQEQNNDRFEVERSLDGRTFEGIGRVRGVGTSSQRHDYQFEDVRPVAQRAYYRLRQVDLDGTATVSGIAVVEGCAKCAPAGSVAVVPNPGTGRFELWSGAAEGTELDVVVHAATGAQVLRQRTVVGAQRPVLNLDAQPAGIYLVRVTSATGSSTVRVVKQ